MGPRCASTSPTPHLHIVLSLLHPLVTPSEAVRHSSPSSISSSLPSSIASPDPPRSLPPSKPRHTDECKTKTHLPFTFLFLRSPCKYGRGTAATCTTVVERRWAHFFPQPTTLHGHDPPRGQSRLRYHDRENAEASFLYFSTPWQGRKMARKSGSTPAASCGSPSETSLRNLVATLDFTGGSS